MIAVPFFFAVLVLALIGSRGAVTASLGVALLTAAMAFAAALVLCVRDTNRAVYDRERVRSMLMGRTDQSSKEFLEIFSDGDRDLAQRLRSQLAQFFDVSATKLRSDDNLDSLSFGRFMPGIYLAVMTGLNRRAHCPGKVISFPTRKLENLST